MSNSKDELRGEYSPELIKSGVRGKYAKRSRQGTNVVLDPDVASEFPDSAAVNNALRDVIRSRKGQTGKAT